MAFVAGLFAALEVGRGFGEIGVDTLVVSQIGPGSLPYLFIGLGAIGLTTSLAYGAALGRVARIPLLAGLLGGAAVDPARRASADGERIRTRWSCWRG